MRLPCLILLILCLCTSTFTRAQSKQIHVAVDERMELLTNIQYLSDYPILTPASLSYKKEVDSFFKTNKDHPAVGLNRNIFRRFFGFDAPPNYIIHFRLPDFEQTVPVSEETAATFNFNEMPTPCNC